MNLRFGQRKKLPHIHQECQLMMNFTSLLETEMTSRVQLQFNSGIGLPPSTSGAWVGQTESLTYSFSFTQMQWLVHKHMRVFLRSPS